MSAAPKVRHITAKQLAADRKNLAKARAAQKGKRRSAKQIAASRANLAKARLATRTRKQGKRYVTAKQKKTAQAPLPGGTDLHSLPVCAAVAVAASLQWQAGAEPAAAEIWALHKLAGAASISGVIEAAASTGLAGYRITSWAPWDPDIPLDGLIYGVQIQEGYHAVLTVRGGMLSWDTILPRRGEPQEAWLVEWVRASG